MPQTFSAASAVELARVERSGFVESRHSGSALVLGPDGTVVEEFGDPGALILPRSALKPLQALACVVAGADLAGQRLALATASHTGTDRHTAVVREILTSAGLDESALACPAAWPEDRATRDEMVRERYRPEPVRMTCSGKHAAMLLACRAAGWDTAGYLEATHPLQVHIRDVVERMTGERPGATAVDGCGAPVFAVSLAALARALHRLGTASPTSPFALHRHAAALLQAVRAHPWAIEGPGRPDTIVVERLGVFAKFGAEGVMTMVAPDATTVAVKILDGGGRAAAVVALRLLERAGAVAPEAVAIVRADLPIAVRGGGREVGTVLPAF